MNEIGFNNDAFQQLPELNQEDVHRVDNKMQEVPLMSDALFPVSSQVTSQPLSQQAQIQIPDNLTNDNIPMQMALEQYDSNNANNLIDVPIYNTEIEPQNISIQNSTLLTNVNSEALNLLSLYNQPNPFLDSFNENISYFINLVNNGYSPKIIDEMSITDAINESISYGEIKHSIILNVDDNCKKLYFKLFYDRFVEYHNEALRHIQENTEIKCCAESTFMVNNVPAYPNPLEYIFPGLYTFVRINGEVKGIYLNLVNSEFCSFAYEEYVGFVYTSLNDDYKYLLNNLIDCLLKENKITIIKNVKFNSAKDDINYSNDKMPINYFNMSKEDILYVKLAIWKEQSIKVKPENKKDVFKMYLDIFKSINEHTQINSEYASIDLDGTIKPFTYIENTQIGENCLVGNFTCISNSQIGAKARISCLANLNKIDAGNYLKVNSGVCCESNNDDNITIGDSVELGTNTTITKAVIIEDNNKTKPNSIIVKDILN